MPEFLEIIKPNSSELKIPLNLPIILEAISRDQKEKDVSDKIVWTSNIGGDLGTGKKICPYLIVGNHIITASITINKKCISKKISLVIIHEDKPPITIRSLMELCWGLSINFSHDQNQREMGKNAREKILRIFADYQTVTFGADDKITYYPTLDTKKFFDNVIMSIIKTMRNIGFTRNNHQNFLDSMKADYANTKKYYDDLSSFASLNEAGFAPKILSFLGGGSILSILSEFGSVFFPKPNMDAINIINATIQSQITDVAAANQASEELVKLAESIPTLPVTGILFFLIFGAISLAGFNLFFIYHKKERLEKKWRKSAAQQKKYYVEIYRIDMEIIIFDFYTDLMSFAKRFFHVDYTENFDDIDGIEIDEEEYDLLYKETEQHHNDWNKIPEKKETLYKLDVSKIKNMDDKVKYFIKYKILPNWFTPVHPEQNMEASTNEKESE